MIPLTEIHRFWATAGPVGAEVVGLKALPSALSILWIILVVPCTFSEPIGLELKQTTGNIYIHAQIFTGCMFIVAGICMWALRAWKVRELQSMGLSKEQREQEIQNDDAIPHPRHSVHLSKTRVKRTTEIARGLWSWQRV